VPGEIVRVSGELDRLLIREAALIRAATDVGAIGGGSPEAMVANLSDAELDAVADGGPIPKALLARFVGDAAPVNVGGALQPPTPTPAAPLGATADTHGSNAVTTTPGKPTPRAGAIADALAGDVSHAAPASPVDDWLASQARDIAESEPDVPDDPIDLLLKPSR
jgi:hypothetical protein